MIFFTIYDHPADYPNHVVMRPWYSSGPGEASLFASIEQARASLPAGLCRIPRFADDVPCLVEAWV